MKRRFDPEKVLQVVLIILTIAIGLNLAGAPTTVFIVITCIANIVGLVAVTANDWRSLP